MTTTPYIFAQADATKLPLADDSVHLVVTSPPYMDARTYGIGANRGCEEWIEWMLVVVRELGRVCTGAVIVNCAGVTRKRNYWPGCEGLLYRAWQSGIQCYRPVYGHRVGVPGSGGIDWYRADVEYMLCFKRAGVIPNAMPTANGHTPKWAPGGEMSYRQSSGTRRNAWGQSPNQVLRNRNADGTRDGRKRVGRTEAIPLSAVHTKRNPDGTMNGQVYVPPVKANPGNLLKYKVGGGLMGHPIAHENEAPFPEAVPEFFIRSHSRPGDVVLDPFSGSGTTVAVANRMGRIGVGFDLRFSQCELGRTRLRNPAMRKTRKPKHDHADTLFAMV